MELTLVHQRNRAMKMNPSPPARASSDLWQDWMLVAFIVGFDVAARLLPHMPNLTPAAASAVFAGTVLRRRALAPLVPLAALVISDSAIGFDSWPLTSLI